MAQIRFFTDEDVYGTVAARLRQKDHDAVSTPEMDRLGESDESQLTWAAQKGRVLMTFNVADFARLHHDWIAKTRHHAGVIVSSQCLLGGVLRRVLALASSLRAEDMGDRLEYLSIW